MKIKLEIEIDTEKEHDVVIIEEIAKELKQLVDKTRSSKEDE